MSIEKKEQISVATAEALVSVLTAAVCSVSGPNSPSITRQKDIGLKLQASIRKRLAKYEGTE